MNITYLIGNGFDIGLRLKTGYRSFLDWYVGQSNESPAGVGIRFGAAAQRGVPRPFGCNGGRGKGRAA